ncbi:MAG: glycosyl hydrolase family 28-related protein [Bacteroidales bacterium]
MKLINKKYIFTLSAFFLTLYFHAAFGQQIIPQQRLTDYTNAGLKDSLPAADSFINVLDLGAIPNDGTADDDAFQSALDLAVGQVAEVWIPAGEYNLTQPLNLSSGTYLTGVSADSVLLKFELPQANNLIAANGSLTNDTTPIQPANTFDTVLICTDTSHSIVPGDVLLLHQDAEDYVTSDWALQAMGQIVEVADTMDNKIFIHEEIRHDYPAGNNPCLIRMEPLENLSVSNLSIERTDSHDQQASNIKFQYVRNAKVHAIISANCIFSHISVRYASHVLIEGSYFHHAHDYGGGGRGYGVEISFATGECLVVNNVFEHLRHSMLLQACSNGNVFAYNYSKDAYWDEDYLPAESAGDLVLHGNYPYRNLFEGNIAQNLVVDNSHGINGPNNAFFRNRLEKYGIFMNTGPATDSVIYVGNEITDNGFLTGLYQLEGSGHIEHANLQYDTWHPDGTDYLETQSLFREYAPCYFTEAGIPWPFAGPPYALDENINPAQQRYEAGNMVFEGCDQPVSVFLKNKQNISMYPNPAVNKVYINGNRENPFRIYLYNAMGYMLKSFDVQPPLPSSIDITDIKSGVYFIVAPDISFQEKLIILKQR